MNKERAKRILLKAWSEMIGLALAIIGWLLNLFGLVGAIPAAIVVIVGVIILAVGVFNKLYAYEEKIDIFENALPAVSVKRVYPRKNIATRDFIKKLPDNPYIIERSSLGTATVELAVSAYREVHGSTDNVDLEEVEQTYVVVDFVNNPQRRVEVHDALDVIARVNYLDPNNNDILKREIKGLWERVEPSSVTARKPDYEFTQTTIPSNGDERSLCVAFKKRDEQDCFAYALESYGKTEFLKNQNLNLGSGVIRVEIVLSGRNLSDTRFAFRLVNPGKDRDIAIFEVVEEGKNQLEKKQ